MSDFIFQGKKVHYRLVGEGRPLLMLNGIMMSTKSWAPFEAALTRGGNRLILVDLLDQGESDAMDEPFSLRLQADMLDALLERLEIPSVAVFGTSISCPVDWATTLKLSPSFFTAVVGWKLSRNIPAWGHPCVPASTPT